MKRISTLLIFQFFYFLIFCQNYIEVSHTSGITNTSFATSLESAATKVNQAVPSSENIDFKVLDFGYYVHVDKIKDANETLWNAAVAKAETLAPFYLLIGKETERISLYTTFKVKLKMPFNGMFTCMDEVKREMMEQQIEIAINDKFESLGGTPNDYPLAEIEGMEILENYFKTYSNCCVNGTYSTNCDACTFSNGEMANYLSSQGYLTYSNTTVTVSTQQYNGLLDSPVNIDLEIEGNKVKFTEELDWFLNGASDFGTTKARVKVFDANNCETFKDFESLSIGSEVYVEDIVIINKDGETLFFYKIHENLINNPTVARETAKRGAIPVVVVWLLKRAAMAGVGALTHILTEVVFEYWLGGHETMWGAWQATDLKFWEVVSAAGEGALGGESKIIQIFWNIGAQITTYVMETPYEEITFEGVFSNTVLGAIQGLLNIYLDELNLFKWVDKYGTEIVHQSLVRTGIKETFFKSRTFRRTFIGVLWDSPTDPKVRGKLMEEVLKFNTFRQSDGWNWVGPQNGPADYVFNGGVTSQVKSIAKINPLEDWANMRASVKKACEQLIQSLNNLPNNTLRMDIPVPDNQMQYSQDALERISDYIRNRYGPNKPNFNQELMDMINSNNIHIGTYSN